MGLRVFRLAYYVKRNVVAPLHGFNRHCHGSPHVQNHHRCFAHKQENLEALIDNVLQDEGPMTLADLIAPLFILQVAGLIGGMLLRTMREFERQAGVGYVCRCFGRGS